MRWNDSSVVVVVVELSQSILTTLTKRMQEMKYAIVYFVFLTSVFFRAFFSSISRHLWRQNHHEYVIRKRKILCKFGFLRNNLQFDCENWTVFNKEAEHKDNTLIAKF